jgi:hypothetical protein
MRFWWRMMVVGVASAASAFSQTNFDGDIDDPPHNYRQRTPQDRFTRLKAAFESGEIALDRSGEKAFLVSLLKALNVPVTSQMLVFSTTSLQLNVISPANPRALYFNEDIYVGFIPRGRIEIVSLDPELGGIFYIADIPNETRSFRAERSERCMNCHVSDDTRYVPGLVIRSVIPGPGGGSLTAYRRAESGHGIPFDQRFGGWHVTGRHGITNHVGNLTGRMTAGEIITISNPPGSRFNFEKYPVATSDILPQLLHEHQAGFVNRVLEAGYRTRTALHASNGKLTSAQATELDEQAKVLVRYLLFADEVPLPSGGVEGDSAYKADFLTTRRATLDGISLKDFDLQKRLFKHRCSYMIYSPVFTALPVPMKERIYGRLASALNTTKPDKEYDYLPRAEKEAIRRILAATLPGFPTDS